MCYRVVRAPCHRLAFPPFPTSGKCLQALGCYWHWNMQQLVWEPLSPDIAPWPPAVQQLNAEPQWFQFCFLSLANHGFPQPQPPLTRTSPSGVLTDCSHSPLFLCIPLRAGLLFSRCRRKRRGSSGRSVAPISCEGSGPHQGTGLLSGGQWKGKEDRKSLGEYAKFCIKKAMAQLSKSFALKFKQKMWELIC